MNTWKTRVGEITSRYLECTRIRIRKKTWNDTEIIVKDLIKKKLNYEDEIEIERAHRVGKKHHRGRQDGSGKTPPRPIVVKISNWKVKEAVL